MSETGKERFILTKSYEIAYALFRIAGAMGERDFAERLRAAGAGILEAAAIEDYARARTPLQAIEALVKFAGDVNMMTPANADLLLREIYVLDAAVVERMNATRAPAVDLSEIFSAGPAEEPAPSTETAEPSYAANPANLSRPAPEESFAAFRNPAMHAEPSHDAPAARGGTTAYAAASGNGESSGFMRADVRQATILDRIRQSGNCRIKDLQEVLPGCSERTLRYDLQSLLERNLIERTGNGGPAVSYRMRQTA